MNTVFRTIVYPLAQFDKRPKTAEKKNQEDCLSVLDVLFYHLGPIVRINLSELHILDPDLCNDIYPGNTEKTDKYR